MLADDGWWFALSLSPAQSAAWHGCIGICCLKCSCIHWKDRTCSMVFLSFGICHEIGSFCISYGLMPQSTQRVAHQPPRARCTRMALKKPGSRARSGRAACACSAAAADGVTLDQVYFTIALIETLHDVFIVVTEAGAEASQ